MYQRVISFFGPHLRSIGNKGSFAQNSAIAFSANVVGILSQIIFSPIIARMYGPQAYGTYAIFNALVTNLGMIGNLFYCNAFVLPKEEDEFVKLVRISLISSLIFSLLVLLLTLVAGMELISLFNVDTLGYWVYFIGPGVLITCLTEISSNSIIRKKAFKENVTIGIPVSIGIRVFYVCFGYFIAGLSSGLIIGDLLGKVAALSSRLFRVLSQTVDKVFAGFTLQGLKEIAVRYKNFPLYVLPGNWINLMSVQMPVYLLTMYFGTSTVGQFAFSSSLLEIPMRLLGNAVSPVFLQKAAETALENPQKLQVLVREIYFKLFYIGIIPFSFLTVFGDLIFAFVFGDQWVLAGVFAGYMGYFYIFRLISSPLSSLFTILKKEKQLFYFQIFIFFVRCGGLLAGVFVFRSEEISVMLFSIGNALAYFYLSILHFKLVKIAYFGVVIRSLAILMVSFCFFYLLRYFIYY